MGFITRTFCDRYWSDIDQWLHTNEESPATLGEILPYFELGGAVEAFVAAPLILIERARERRRT